MITTDKAIEQEVIRIISRTKKVKPSRLQSDVSLEQKLGFDTLDVVDIILALEKNFHIVIPDEVPINTVGDFVTYVADHTETVAA
ncbi:acyl carrier protein [Pontibacter burrus]|uniref:Acyl carrier protein n=1 Tax=Pontibacter burrus TaxID=2704466 RepID=A0A6B3LRK8_9BACT|nr:phosphopantetheine-binding protein [Pontibacter burrus]NEM96100.1 acyl carrier protein [Pontibacter burrus]